MHKGLLITAFILGAISVGLGAFAAHSLKAMISDNAIATFETGVRYQFYHVFALLTVAILYKDFPAVRLSGWLFIAGIILFSGSLYALSILQGMVQPGYKWVGAITPFGGLMFICGWLWMVIAVVKKR
ncbi:MAG: DUF423 domain-containing protein [Chitinophagaceae bacterium]|nr:MAG: DUF423 domain-containing protein [Chitinophagaceae bacterium]